MSFSCPPRNKFLKKCRLFELIQRNLPFLAIFFFTSFLDFKGLLLNILHIALYKDKNLKNIFFFELVIKDNDQFEK
jgi:hypothetical protein